MKKSSLRNALLVFGVLALGLTTLQLRKAPAHQASGAADSVAPEEVESVQAAGSRLGSGEDSNETRISDNPRNYLSDAAPGSAAVAIDLGAIKDVLALDRKVLRTRAEDEAYHEALQDTAKLRLAASALARIQEPVSDESLHQEQSERMDAALFLTRALEWKENPQGPQVRDIVKNLILDDAVTRAQDARLKKSLAADRIELFANLKGVDPQAAALVQSRAQSESSKRVIRFATNFYRLDEQKKR